MRRWPRRMSARGAGSRWALWICRRIDEELLLRLHDSEKMLFVAEQNNGYIWQSLLKVLYQRRKSGRRVDKIVAINTLTAEGKPRFIHSGNEELLPAFGLAPLQLAETVRERVAALGGVGLL